MGNRKRNQSIIGNHSDADPLSQVELLQLSGTFRPDGTTDEVALFSGSTLSGSNKFTFRNEVLNVSGAIGVANISSSDSLTAVNDLTLQSGSVNQPNFPHLSITAVRESSIYQSSNFNIWNNSFWTTWVQDTDWRYNGAPSKIGYTPGNGRFFPEEDGLYMINVSMYISSSATQSVDMRIAITGTGVWASTPFVHASVDAVERSVSIMQPLLSGNDIRINLRASTASPVSVVSGTTLNVWKMG